jgi:phosphoglycerate dehydrogenase-like enzyme
MGMTFRVGVTRTLLKPDGTYDLSELGLDRLAGTDGIELGFLDELTEVVQAEQLRGLDAVVVENCGVAATSVEGLDRLAIVARYGSGYDAVDLEACTRNSVLVTNAPVAVRRPMATANLAFLLALSLRMLTKDRLTRQGRWDESLALLGMGLIGRTFGLVGMGNIGRETLRLIAPLEMRCLVHDPYLGDEAIRAAGAVPASLETLLGEADFVCIAVPLTAGTRGLIGEPQLRLMKPTAFLINASRGAIVDQRALTRALVDGTIQGAGLDVLEQEPIASGDPLLALDNVILTSHSLGNTDECFVLAGQSAGESILDVAAGRVPRFVVNRAVLDDRRLQAKLAGYGSRAANS